MAPNQALAQYNAFSAYLAPLRDLNWYVHIKPPFAGPDAVLEYLGRYTHRVALANSRLIAYNNNRVTFWHKNYRGDTVRHQPMTLDADEFMRRFLLHVLPRGFHRIRHYGLLASHVRADNLVLARTLLGNNRSKSTTTVTESENNHSPCNPYLCPTCGKPMLIIQTFEPTARDPPRLPFAA